MSITLKEISQKAHEAESESIQNLLQHVGAYEQKHKAIHALAGDLVTRLREEGSGSGVESFLHAYGLNTREGVAVMCLAEALLRIPDSETADRLIEDTFSESKWEEHLGKSDSLFVNASTYGLLLTGKVINLDKDLEGATKVGSMMRGLIKSSGEPVIRNSIRAAMKLMGDQFVLGETIDRALKRAREPENKGYRTSYDLLGEGARTHAQAMAYLDGYLDAIGKIGKAAKGKKGIEAPSISVKLSALHPRYDYVHRERVFKELLPRVKQIVCAARDQGITVSIDAEEASRLDIELELFERLYLDDDLRDYDGLSFVLQAYQKRAFYIIDWLAALAKQGGRQIPVRLVKGAYWDSEIKWAQVEGLDGYPVFTRKYHTDVSYLACAKKLLDQGSVLFPQFATHNVLTVAAIIEVAGDAPFEFQRLYGMGQRLYEQTIKDYPCRVYAPVGVHKDLLAYLIRRLLENGANKSFVNLLMDREKSLEEILEDPIEKARESHGRHAANIVLPEQIYAPDRRNSHGWDWGNKHEVTHAQKEIGSYLGQPLVAPRNATKDDIHTAYETAQAAFKVWERHNVFHRAQVLEKAADLIEENAFSLMALCTKEAKKTHMDALAEIREAADFCRYYAARSRDIIHPQLLIGPTGESNTLSLHGRGIFVCISPWNFPLAIFVGQVVAALVTGNCVLAKPAEQTPAIAAAAVKLLHEAGVPKEVLQLVCGEGETVGAGLVAHPACAGVAFTGSTGAAKAIQRALADKDGPIVPLIAETGGMNAMMVDSSALLEQATDDIVNSAFGSAGQRCSALRVLYVQEDIADDLWEMVSGAMDALEVGPTDKLSCDVGPVIDSEAQAGLMAHIARMKKEAKQYKAAPADTAVVQSDSFVVPHMFEISDIKAIGPEQFGPILHVIRYAEKDTEKVVQAINSTGYGLTFGLQSRIIQNHIRIMPEIHAGNMYVNRNMIGATVGVQPFGGEGLSGTGPKAGGPYYLLRFASERTTTINTTAIGGNLELLG